MFDLDVNDLYFPNAKVIRDLLESLNYTITPLRYKEVFKHGYQINQHDLLMLW